MNDDDSYYEKFCRDEFRKHGEKIDELMITVKNGLSHRVKRIDRVMWFIAALFITKWVSELFL